MDLIIDEKRHFVLRYKETLCESRGPVESALGGK